MQITFLNLFILASALWRLSNLLANESGPLDLFGRFRSGILRARMKNQKLRYLLAEFYRGCVCEWCNSVWLGMSATLAWWRFGDVVVLIVLPLAFSTWVIFQKYLLHLIRNAEEYLYKLKETPRWIGGVDFGKTADKSSFAIYERKS